MIDPIRKRKRSLKSFYYDKHTKRIGKASTMPSKPSVRKTRYLFLGQYVYKTQKALESILKDAYGIKIKKPKDLPF